MNNSPTSADIASRCDQQLIAEGACLLERFAKKERAHGQSQLASAAERSAQAIRRAHNLHLAAINSAARSDCSLSLGSAIGGISLSEAIQSANALQVAG